MLSEIPFNYFDSISWQPVFWMQGFNPQSYKKTRSEKYNQKYIICLLLVNEWNISWYQSTEIICLGKPIYEKDFRHKGRRAKNYQEKWNFICYTKFEFSMQSFAYYNQFIHVNVGPSLKRLGRAQKLLLIIIAILILFYFIEPTHFPVQKMS